MSETKKDAESENRRHGRAAIELEVEYKRLNTFFHDYTQNISKGGTFIKTSKPLPIETKFLFRLKVPLLENPIELTGLVRWILTTEEAGNKGEAPGMGIEFIYDDDEHRKLIERAVQELMVQQLGERAYDKLLGSSDG